MRQLRLGIDLDGVVADFNRGWTELYNQEFGTRLHHDDVVEWDAPTGLTHFATMNEFWRWARTCSAGSSVFRHLAVYPGAIDALHGLADHHTIVVVTTKPAFAVDDTHAWLTEQELPADEVHITFDKAEIDCDLYLDDAVHNLESLVDRHPGATVLRYVRPWNDPVPGTIDVHGWTDVVDAVRTAATTPG